MWKSLFVVGLAVYIVILADFLIDVEREREDL